MLKEKIGFIGGGKMGEALAKGLIRAKLSTADNIIVSDVDNKRCQVFEEETGIKTTQDNREVTANSDVIILAVKPNIMGTILEELKNNPFISNSKPFLKFNYSLLFTLKIHLSSNRRKSLYSQLAFK